MVENAKSLADKCKEKYLEIRKNSIELLKEVTKITSDGSTNEKDEHGNVSKGKGENMSL